MAVSLEIIKELVESVVVVATAEGDVNTVISSPDDLSVDWRIEYEERAAILQWDAGLARKDADRQAFDEILERIKRSE